MLLLACGGGKGNPGDGEEYLKDVNLEDKREGVRRDQLELEAVRTKEGSAVASNGKVHV